MMRRDLIAKYGEGHGTREKDLRKALLVRNLVFGGLGTLLIGGSTVFWLLAPVIFGWVALVMLGVAALAGVIVGGLWLADKFPEYLREIQNAKDYGVMEDK